MRVRTSLALAALAVTLLAPTAVSARGSDAAAAAKAEQNRIIAYWTPARIAAAKFKDYVIDANTGRIVPFARPGGGTSGTGASWPGTAALDPVELRVGRILFSSGGSDWICSGTVVNDTDANYSVILTAGHCVFDGNDGWSYNFLFMPDFDDNPDYSCSTRVMGCWTANRLSANTDFVPGGFSDDASLRVDYGFARVGTGNKLGQLDAQPGVAGGYALNTSVGAAGPTAWAFGYPAEGKYKGKDLIYCTGGTVEDPYDVGTWGLACKMNGGSSGGGWLFGTTDPSNGSGSLGSVNSYGYSGLSYMFGPIFNSETADARTAVLNGSAPNSVVCTTGTTQQSVASCPGQ
jgi:hypothetical protein